MRFFITGHTGFKGSWLTLMLKHLGHEVYGLSLEPAKNGLYNLANLNKVVDGEIFCNVLNLDEFRNYFKLINPDISIHLAAQSLVKKSYNDPSGTFNENIIGTMNFLKVVTDIPTTRANLVITSDKVYKNVFNSKPFSESDSLGGADPYSASKSCADILAQSWVESFKLSPTAIARSGNVIGGGDWAENRLIPDIVNAINKGTSFKIRYPNAIRPWQHVLDCLNGYILLIENMLEKQEGGIWNFGPTDENFIEVSKLFEIFLTHYGKNCKIEENLNSDVQIHKESLVLKIDSSKARKLLGWNDELNLNSAVKLTAHWYKSFYSGANALNITQDQIKAYYET